MEEPKRIFNDKELENFQRVIFGIADKTAKTKGPRVPSERDSDFFEAYNSMSYAERTFATIYGLDSVITTLKAEFTDHTTPEEVLKSFRAALESVKGNDE